jgi:hypothetical protein
MDQAQADTLDRLAEILLPEAGRHISNIRKEDTKFVHYTSAEGAFSILKNKCIWLRNSSLMNDFSEVQHGLNCLREAWAHENLGLRFNSVINQISSKTSPPIEGVFNQHLGDLINESYLVSFSAHGNDEEDQYGRLSMWRAYGKTTGVALVMKNGPFIRHSGAITASTTPVLYADKILLIKYFQEIIESIERNISFLKQLDENIIQDLFQNIMNILVLSTKHKGFHEEKEWRVIYSPTIYPCDNIHADYVTLNGVPQKIYKIPFTNHPEQGFTGATIPEMLDKIIIGPTAHPYPVAKTFIDLLEENGVPNPQQKVVVSDIPLRQ